MAFDDVWSGDSFTCIECQGSVVGLLLFEAQGLLFVLVYVQHNARLYFSLSEAVAALLMSCWHSWGAI